MKAETKQKLHKLLDLCLEKDLDCNISSFHNQITVMRKEPFGNDWEFYEFIYINNKELDELIKEVEQYKK